MIEKPILLIVDDEEHVTRSLMRSLRDQYNIFTANSAREALEILDKQKVGVVLTDQRMPDMTGVELLKVVREKYPFASGILLSAYSDSMALVDAINLGIVRGFIPKPWDINIVRSKLQDAVQVFESLMKKDGGDESFDHQQLEEIRNILEMVGSSALDSLFQPGTDGASGFLGGAPFNQKVLDQMQDGFAAIRDDGCVWFCNLAFCRMLSIDEKNQFEYRTIEDLKQFPEMILAIKKGLNGEYTHANCATVLPAGKQIFLEIGVTPVFGNNERPQTLLVIRDQTEREKTIAHLRALNEVTAVFNQFKQYRTGLEFALQACIRGLFADAAAVYFKNLDGKALQFSGSFGLHPNTVDSLTKRGNFICAGLQNLSGGGIKVKSFLDIDRKEFQLLPEVCEDENITSAAVAPMIDSTGLAGVLAVYTRSNRLFDDDDITLLKSIADQIAITRLSEHLYEQLQNQAHFDYLTNLNNRHSFFELAERQYARARQNKFPVAVFMIDVDHFKQINDLYGHLVGDLTLKKIAELLNECLRPGDLVSRYGGDEFALLIADCDSEIAKNISGRIQAKVELLRLIVEDLPVQIGLSIGYEIAKYDRDETLEGLLTQADFRMYINKREKAVQNEG